ncbi:hypothetical protein ACERC8_01435 [Streptococcus sp. E29BA]|uniref:hypothetical protein n=1 Tax=Streptococcus sp. E29BA TaxID=3278716 RepID=UPI00359CE290
MYSDGELICPNCYRICQDEVWRCKDNHVADDSAYCSEHCLHDSLFIVSEDIDRALEEFRKREEE